MEKDRTYKDAVEHGHTWVVLPDSTPEEAARRISKWYNQEQNKNIHMDEVELIRMCLDILDEFLALHHGEQTMKLVTLTLALSQRIPLSLNPSVLSNFGRWTMVMCQHNARDLIAAFLDWHSATIKPKEQSLPPSLFETLSSESLQLRKFPGFQIILVYAAYTDEQKRCSIRPKADVCNFITPKVVESLAKNPDVVSTLNKHAMDTFGPLLEKLKEKMSEAGARECAIRYVVALVRAAMGKGTKDLGLQNAGKKRWARKPGRGQDHGDQEDLGLGSGVRAPRHDRSSAHPWIQGRR